MRSDVQKELDIRLKHLRRLEKQAEDHLEDCESKLAVAEAAFKAFQAAIAIIEADYRDCFDLLPE